MSTTQQILSDGTVAANRVASGFRGVDARRRRFALNPGLFMPVLEPRESGRQEHLLPSGLVTFRTALIADDDFEHALKNGHNLSALPQRTTVEVPALTFLQNALTRFGEQGMRELSCLTMLDDPQPNEKGNVTKEQFQKSAQGYFAALWPAFADIGHLCPHETKECVTCRLWLIGDPSDPGSMSDVLIERTEKLTDQALVVELRAQIYDCLIAAKTWLEGKWASLLGEMEDRKSGGRGISKLGPGEHHVRRNLHEVEPSEAATAAGFGAEVAAGQAEGFKELASAMRESKPSNDNSELMKMMIERQNKTDDALASLAESVKTLVDKQA